MTGDVPAVLERAQRAGVQQVVVPSTGPADSAEAQELARIYPQVFAAIGIHPSDAATYTQPAAAQFEAWLQENPEIRAIGEVGLDYYYFTEGEDVTSVKEEQKRVFAAMLELARAYEKPLIIHSREAFADTYAMLQPFKDYPVVLHCFTGTAEEAAAWLGLGFHISLTGILTFKKNQPFRDMVSKLPLEKLMLETDAPYLAPEGFRKESCEPRHVVEVAKCLAQIKGMTVEAVDEITTATAKKFFNLP